MEFRIKCRLAYDIKGSASFLFNVAAEQNPLQKVITEDFQLLGAASCQEFLIGRQRFHRVLSTVDRLELKYAAVVELNPKFLDPDSLEVRRLQDLPPEVLVFLYPSRFCQSDLLARFANREFHQSESGFERVTRFCNWIYEYIEYLPGLTNSSTSAFDTATQRAGVCRDFAHLGIAFSRALSIPARFVSCYAFGLTPPDFHAHFEAFLGDQWILFDPTRLSPQSSFVRIGHGRDAADTSFATIVGNANLIEMEISTDIGTVDANARVPQFVTVPISTCPSLVPQ
jgi:transglutaminase-like putative cysteine protease